MLFESKCNNAGSRAFTGKSTITVVSFSPYPWFEEWKDEKVKNRGAEYKELKMTIISSVLEVVTQIFPKVKDRVRTSCHLQFAVISVF